MALNLRKAKTIIKGIMAKGDAAGFKPLSVVVLDAGGHLIAFERSDGASAGRFDIARGKAYGCIMVGLGGTAIQARGEAQARQVMAKASIDLPDGDRGARLMTVVADTLLDLGNTSALLQATGEKAQGQMNVAVSGVPVLLWRARPRG